MTSPSSTCGWPGSSPPSASPGPTSCCGSFWTSGGVQKNVFAGIAKAYEPEALIGKMVVFFANLKPRQMKWGLSEGMILASGSGGKEVFLLSVDPGAQAGQKIS